MNGFVMTESKRRKTPLTGYAETCRAWLANGMTKPEMKVPALAAKLGLNRTAIYKLMKGTQPIKTRELPIIALYIGEPVPPLPGEEKWQTSKRASRRSTGPVATTIEIEREIGIGTWSEDGQLRDADIKTISIVVSPEFPSAQHHAYKFKGDSMDDIGVLDGDIIFCVAYEDTASTPLDGKAVVIERNRAGLIEVSLRIAKVFSDRVEYVTASRNQSYKPVIVDKKGKVKNELNETVKVVSVYIGRTSGALFPNV